MADFTKTSTMSSRKRTPPSTENRQSEDEVFKVPAKKSSPSLKHPPTINNPYSASLKAITGIDDEGMNDSTTSLTINYSTPAKNVNAASLPMVTDISDTKMHALIASPSPSDLLAKFGLKLPSRTAQTPRSADQKIIELKCCVIDGGENSAVLFRFAPNGSWCEKLMYDEVCKKHSEWTTILGFVDYNPPLTWFVSNKEQLNSRNYAIRLFVIETTQSITNEQQLINLGEDICAHVNEVADNTREIVKVNELNYFWIPIGSAVWADVIGTKRANDQLVKKIGTPTGEAHFYNTNKSCIDSYFHSGTYTRSFARYLGAPPKEIHPNERNQILNLNNDENANVDPDL